MRRQRVVLMVIAMLGVSIGAHATGDPECPEGPWQCVNPSTPPPPIPKCPEGPFGCVGSPTPRIYIVESNVLHNFESPAYAIIRDRKASVVISGLPPLPRDYLDDIFLTNDYTSDTAYHLVPLYSTERDTFYILIRRQ